MLRSRASLTAVLLFVICWSHLSSAQVRLGADQLFEPENLSLIKGKRIGLICNQTSVDSQMVHTADRLADGAKQHRYRLSALFCPEHGFRGVGHAGEHMTHETFRHSIPVYSLHGTTRRPTDAMLKNIDVLIFDIQDVGARSYTYLSTLCYCMEEAAKHSIRVIVLDRPNPINGLTVDGPMLEDKWRSFVGYLNVPYCHGMTFGELARFFNQQQKLGCSLTVIPMEGWKRHMSYRDTGLAWVPSSPNIPEADTPLYYPSTGILGELQIVSIGIGYTLPFRCVGAPWLDSERFAEALNKQNFPGVHFLPFHYKPFYGRFKGKDCQGVLIQVTDSTKYLPVATQYLIIGVLKAQYPTEFKNAIAKSKNRLNMFHKVNGTEEVYRILSTERYVVWKLRAIHEKERRAFSKQRRNFLIPSYS